MTSNNVLERILALKKPSRFSSETRFDGLRQTANGCPGQARDTHRRKKSAGSDLLSRFDAKSRIATTSSLLQTARPGRKPPRAAESNGFTLRGPDGSFAFLGDNTTGTDHRLKFQSLALRKLIAIRGQASPRPWPRAWMGRKKRSVQAQNLSDSYLNEVIVMRRTFECASWKFVLAFMTMSAGTLAVLLFFQYALPENSKPVSTKAIAHNIFNARYACVQLKNQSVEFDHFCADNFIETNRGIFLKPRNEITPPARPIVIDPQHTLHRYFRINANATDIFGSDNQMLENRIAAYTRVECAIKDGKRRNLEGFEAISWENDPRISPICDSNLEVQPLPPKRLLVDALTGL